jgi:exonuclease-1
MGIRRLLSFLKRSIKIVDLNEYSGLTCGIDGHSLLHGYKHKLLKVILDENPDFTILYTFIAEQIIKMKKNYNITSIIVIDGDSPPIKAKEKAIRTQKRENILLYVNELIKNQKYKKAAEEKINSISFKPPFIKDFIEILKKYEIDYIICPYESDYELKYLEQNKVIDFIIGNDSDFVAYGCKNVIFEFDLEKFEGLKYNQDECKKLFFDKNFSEEKLLYQCLFRGCDFFEGISKNLNIIRNVIQNEKDNNYVKIIKKLLKGISNESKENVLEETINQFEKALIIYKYGIVYCPFEKKGKYLNDLPKDKNNFVYKYNLDNIVGKIHPPNIMYGITIGEINPITLDKLEGNKKSNQVQNNNNLNNEFNPFLIAYDLFF